MAPARFENSMGAPMLGRYAVLGTLGQGGMGTVFEAFDRTLDRKVAVKVLHTDLGGEHTARLLREAQAMAKLSHPNVVSVFEVDTVDDQPFVVMELVQGQTLRQWLRQDPRPDWRRCVEVFIQAGQGLVAAHSTGLVHRDFKPSNVLIDGEGRARVFDFGLARRVEVHSGDNDTEPLAHTGKTEDDRSLGVSTDMLGSNKRTRVPSDGNSALGEGLTKTGLVMGTPAYMPPEQATGRQIDARSDQFSFCVSLYEAVYGERPFTGSTLTELVASVTDGNLQLASKGRLIPVRLRTILQRGLAADPVQRWPSMDALLHELRALVAPRTRIWTAMGVAAGLAALGGGLAVGQYAEVKDRCTGAQAQMDGVWDDARRQQVRASVLGTERSFSASTWARIEPQLDAYADAWVQTYTMACEATSVHGEQPQQALDLRMRCLGERRVALRAAVDVLAETNAEVVTKAVEVVAGLPALTRCNDLEWLQKHDQRVPPPEDPEVETAVVAQRARLTDIKAMHDAGRYAEGLEAVEVVVEQADALGYPPLRAEALRWRGTLRIGDGQYAEAEQDLRQAYTLAIRHQHDSVALDAAQDLTDVVGHHLMRHAEAQQWGEMVALPLAQRSGDPLQEAQSSSDLGSLSLEQGDHESARHYYQQALATRQEVLGPAHPGVANSLNHLGGLFESQGDYTSARHHFERALAIYKEVHGPDHPNVAISLNNLGGISRELGDKDSARRHFERALAIWEKALGPDHPSVAGILNNLGAVAKSVGDYDSARRHFERSLAIREKTLGPNHPHVAMSLNNLGIVFWSQGDKDSARHHFEQALAIREEALGPDHYLVAHPLVSLAGLALETNDSGSAVAYAERAVAVREAASGTPVLIADARFVLARALWSKRGERTRARALAEQVRRAYAEHGPGREDDLADVDAWLATHRVK
ncbi:MAG: tetratricopeptide repeat protein [Myxococcota bacterium]